MSGAEGDSNGVADSHLILSLLLGTLNSLAMICALLHAAASLGISGMKANKLISAQPAQDGVIFKYTF